MGNLKENDEIPAELLSVKVWTQNYPGVLCGRGFYMKTRLNFNRLFLSRDLTV